MRKRKAPSIRLFPQRAKDAAAVPPSGQVHLAHPRNDKTEAEQTIKIERHRHRRLLRFQRGNAFALIVTIVSFKSELPSVPFSTPPLLTLLLLFSFLHTRPASLI